MKNLLRRQTSNAMGQKLRLLIAVFLMVVPLLGLSQNLSAIEDQTTPSNPPNQTSEMIAVKNVADDTAIQKRITEILKSSGWFFDLGIDVSDGVVQLSGATASKTNKEWAEKIASRTQDVVAVINRISVSNNNAWTLAPAVVESKRIMNSVVASAPIIILCGGIFLLTLMATRTSFNFTQRLLSKKIESNMLRRLMSKLLSIPVFLFGIYLILNISGLSKLAVTILGGTGLIGLVIGIAFRDITENFLASILISIQRPFRLGDHIRVLDFDGFVQAVTTRGTVIMTLEGNHVQIPNSTIYKQPIVNFSANPNMRLDFTVGIGYDSDIAKAQQYALDILKNHPAVLNEPEMLVLAEELASSTVLIRLYFWINAQTHSGLKIKSSVIRLVKSTYMEKGISMPDDAREIIFPEGIPSITPPRDQQPSSTSASIMEIAMEKPTIASAAEGDLTSEAHNITKQAQKVVLGENETNILGTQ